MPAQTDFRPLTLCVLTVSDTPHRRRRYVRRLPRCRAGRGRPPPARTCHRERRQISHSRHRRELDRRRTRARRAHHRRHRFYGPRHDTRSGRAAARQDHAGLRRNVPRDQLRGNRHVDDAVTRLRRPRQQFVRVLPARLDVGLPHRLGKTDPRAARRAHQTLQPRRTHAAPARGRGREHRFEPLAVSKGNAPWAT